MKSPLAIELRRIAIFPPKKDLSLNREKSNIGYSLEINFSIKTNMMINDNPPTVNKNMIKILDIIPNDHNVIPANTRNNPPANEIFPSQSIFSFLIDPSSFRYVEDHNTPIIPIGIFIQKIDLQPK